MAAAVGGVAVDAATGGVTGAATLLPSGIAALEVGGVLAGEVVLAGVASGSGVKIVVTLLAPWSLVALESEPEVALAVELESELAPPESSIVGAALLTALLEAASVGSGTGRKARNNPAAIRAKIMAPIRMAPTLVFFPSSRDIRSGGAMRRERWPKANAVPEEMAQSRAPKF